MDFVTIAFAVTDAPHVAEGRAALAAAGAVEIWPGLWLMEGRCGAEETKQKLVAVYKAFACPAHLPPGIIVSPLDDRCAVGIGSSMSLESLVVYHRWLAAGSEARSGRVSTNTYRFIGDGQVRFAELVAAADKVLDLPREVTDLCRAMSAHGSDKGLGWHTYTPFYARLIAQLPRAPRNLLEIGIGTNNEDVPSTMGRNGTPGASLRGWRDHLPTTRIFGADVDDRILFEEERISTFLVDQLDVGSLARLWDKLPDEPFDLILDDGLHTLEAARNTLSCSIDHLDDDGFYIVEDVLLPDMTAYVQMADAHGLDGFVVQIPHAVNTYDNCLLVAAKKPSTARSRDATAT